MWRTRVCSRVPGVWALVDVEGGRSCWEGSVECAGGGNSLLRDWYAILSVTIGVHCGAALLVV